MSLKPVDAALVVFDFDGTLTDVDAHAEAFYAASRQALADQLGWDEAEHAREWAASFAAVMALSATAAWQVGGRDACPARVDPYMIANSVTHRLLAEHRPGDDPATRVASVLAVHSAAYQQVSPQFRPDAQRVLEQLLAGGYPVRVVSNSQTTAIERMLDSLALAGRERVLVHGDAGKFSVCEPMVPDARFDALPETVGWWEGGRPIHVRRGKYFDVLRAIWDDTGTNCEQTLVVGDVFELDLAMPAALGAHIHLVTRAGTMPHERRIADDLPRGAAGAPLAAVLERLRAFGSGVPC